MQTDAKLFTNRDDRPTAFVNANLSIELTEDEILADLLYPAKTIEAAR